MSAENVEPTVGSNEGSAIFVSVKGVDSIDGVTISTKLEGEGNKLLSNGLLSVKEPEISGALDGLRKEP